MSPESVRRTTPGAALVAAVAPLAVLCACVHVLSATSPSLLEEWFEAAFATIHGALAVGLLVIGLVGVRGLRRDDRGVVPQAAVAALVLFFAYLACLWALLRGFA